MTSAERKYCVRSRSWFKPARKNSGVNELCLWNDMFRANVMIIWPVTDAQMRDAMKFYAVPDDDFGPLHEGCAKFVNTLPPDDRRFIFLAATKTQALLLANAAHEFHHCAGDLLKGRGIHQAPEYDETGAYLTGWLMEEFALRAI